MFKYPISTNSCKSVLAVLVEMSNCVPVPFGENMGYGHTGSTETGADFIVEKEGNTSIAQIGEDVFSLEAIGNDKFKFDPIGATFEFNPKSIQ